MKKKELRFALMLDEKRDEVFIMVDYDVISEGLWEKNGKWEDCYRLELGNFQPQLISKFEDWSKGKSFELTGIGKFKGKKHTYNEIAVFKMKQAVMERDKRIKLK
jgi:hypothetical protein